MSAPISPRQGSLWAGHRLQMTDSIRLTAESLATYGASHAHWATAWSGGKDSSAVTTLVVHMIRTKMVPAPKSFRVLYADTRMELLPLSFAAAAIREELEEVGVEVEVVMAPLDDRFFVYMFGRGVPPPSNTFRWCTPQIKIEPMQRALERVAVERGLGAWVRDEKRGREVYRGHGVEKLLVLTGVRVGESAARDARIALSCSKDGAECGQGWYQQTLPTALCDTLAPILHWRVCHVWEWLKHWAPTPEFGDWSTAVIADAYGGDEAEERNARTGCVGCNLASDDHALKLLLRNPQWAYLAPLLGLRRLYAELKLPANRLRKPGGERIADGELAANQQRMGPLTFEARRMGLDRVLAIQAEVNAAARRLGRPTIDLVNEEEAARIHELIAAQTWPHGLDGTEPTADVMLDRILPDGSVQPLLIAALRGTR
jgi:DNA sulfur modification protein DndC